MMLETALVCCVAIICTTIVICVYINSKKYKNVTTMRSTLESEMFDRLAKAME